MAPVMGVLFRFCLGKVVLPSPIERTLFFPADGNPGFVTDCWDGFLSNTPIAICLKSNATYSQQLLSPRRKQRLSDPLEYCLGSSQRNIGLCNFDMARRCED